MSGEPSSHPPDLPEIVGVEIRRYKNLADIWLPWSDGMAVFGANGVGKTNLLEALALLLGSPQTLGWARSRLEQPAPHALSLVARVPASTLPWSPDVVLDWPQEMQTAEEGVENPFARLFEDARWWRMLGADAGADFWTGLTRADVPDPVRFWLASLQPVSAVSYSLASISRRPATNSAGPAAVERLFSRTLLVRTLPDEVGQVAAELPDLFAPLRTHLAHDESTPDGWVPLLELPASTEPPGVLQWLPHSRTPDEVNDDLDDAFRRAREGLTLLTGVLGDRLAFLTPLGEEDWHWLAHEIAAKEAQIELATTVPQVQVIASGGGDADFAVVAGDDERSHTGDDDVLVTLSAGERRWADEALASAARELIRFGQLAELYSSLAADLEDTVLVEAVDSVVGNIEASIESGGYWSGEAFEQLLRAVEPTMLAAARDMAHQDHPVLDFFIRRMHPGLTLLEPQVVIRVIDEPEAHLHPTAQRRVAAALEGLRRRGQNMVLASHSPHFLDLPGWSQLHLSRSDEAVGLSRVPDSGKVARTALAHDLGVTRGELLAGINAVLVVEGLHDQFVLRSLFEFELKSAGVAVVRMFGTNHLLATAELDFIDEYMDVPILVLLDNTRVDRVKSGKFATEEEEKLWHLQRSCRRRRRRLKFYGLHAPDIVCYLSESAVRQTNPAFPGWKEVIAVFRRLEERGSRPSFKTWFRNEYDINLTDGNQIAAVLATMKEGGHRPVGELTRLVNELVAVVTTGPNAEAH